jgi:glutathionylspermidine synthase
VKDIKPKHWSGYFNTETLSCNHPIALFAQTKRFPLIWDVLEQNGISMSTWRSLLPETLEVKDAKGKEGFIYKPAYGRVGEKIAIKEACTDKEYKKIMMEVALFPKRYLAQKKFISAPLLGSDGKEYHVCLGSYTVNGKHAGFYARVSEFTRIDSNAADIPVLIEGEEKDNDK